MARSNMHAQTVSGFGDEWSRFDQSALSEEESSALFTRYFKIFPWAALPQDAQGFDLGCGSGRWARKVAPRVGKLHLIDASFEALAVARENLSHFPNCEFHSASVDAIPLEDESMDFGYSLGVLHHVPDTLSGIRSCVQKLKPGAPFLIYLYYRFDNRPFWFKAIWKLSDLLRRAISSLPHEARYWASQVIAALVYWPLARTARLMAKIGFEMQSFPLSSYKNLSFYSMRTDALDRFGTRLEKRFTKQEIREMLEKSGLEKISFNEQSQFWCAVGFKRLS
jgi:ubiquinone/menaquinone biosynthesis C-methylase UbiE